MSYKIFLSYSVQESELAEFIRNVLNKSFKNKVEFFFNNIRGGEKWKDVIQKGLNESDAILTILTPRYLQRPWAYIEWASFWLRDKTTYVIVTDDVEIKDIVDPMKDIQCTRIFSESDVIKLMESIAEKSESDYIPYEIVTEIVNKSKAIYGKVLSEYERNKYSIYKSASELLPNDDFKKVEILWYFFEKESDRKASAEVFKSINDNSIKANILIKLLDKGEFDLIAEIYESVESKNNLLPLLKGLIENGYEDSELTDKILAYISASQSTLRSFCEYLIKNRKAESKALINSIPLFTNRGELRKLGECLIDNSYVTDKVFDIVVQHFYGFNHAELQKLLKYAITSEKYNRKEIAEQIVKLAAQNQREAEKVVEELIKKDKDLVRNLLYDIKIITNPEILKRLEEHLGE
jgi:hypothetical protein